MQNNDVKELFSAMKMLNDKVEKMEKEYLARIEELEKQVKEIQNGSLVPKESLKVAKVQTLPSGNSIEKRPAEVSKVSDPYSKENFIDRGDYYELVIPIGTIRMIEKPLKVERRYELAKNYHKKCSAGGFSDWRLPTIDELEMIFQAVPFRKVYGEFLSSSSYHDDYTDNTTNYCYERDDYTDDSTNKAFDFDSYKVFCVR